MILRVMENKDFTLALEDTYLEKPQGKGVSGQIDTPAFLGLRKSYIIDAWQGSEYSWGSEYTRILNMQGLRNVLNKTFRIDIWKGPREICN